MFFFMYPKLGMIYYAVAIFVHFFLDHPKCFPFALKSSWKNAPRKTATLVEKILREILPGKLLGNLISRKLLP